MRMSTPTLCTSLCETRYSASPTTPPWDCKNTADHDDSPGSGLAPELTPSVPAASAIVTAAAIHVAPVLSGRISGHAGRASSAPPPATKAIGAKTFASPMHQPRASVNPPPTRPPFQPPYRTKPRNTPTAIIPNPSMSS